MNHRFRPLTATTTLMALVAGLAGGCGATPATPATTPTADQKPAHHTAAGFKNNYPHEEVGAQFLKWQWERLFLDNTREPDKGWASVIPSVKPELPFLQSNRSQRSVTWLGHASVLLQTGGLNLVTDPMLSERASPVSFAGPKRLIPVAISANDLPPIDVVVISHNHYDHLDLPSVKAINERNAGATLFLVPLGMKTWFLEQGINNVRELDWWQHVDVKGKRIHFVPVQHWSKRTAFDRNQSLWGGYVLEDKDWRFFYAGDTGYSKDFQDIGERFGSIQLAALPIGAYAPRWFMKAQHLDTEDAVQVMLDVRAQQAVGVHWGTFVLTDESPTEPPRALAASLQKRGIGAARFPTLAHGQTLRLAP
jgi:N-acyl-phosphatidylethanolamine-hydrolysing phospholipase D